MVNQRKAKWKLVYFEIMSYLQVYLYYLFSDLQKSWSFLNACLWNPF